MHDLIVFGAKYLIVFPVVVFGWFFLLKAKNAKKEVAGAIILAGVLAGLVDKLGSHFYYSTRPFVRQHIEPLVSHAADNGFPSEHTLLAATIAAVIYFYNRKLGLYLAVIAVLIGIARMAAHVHSAIDVVGSLAIAGFAGWAGYVVARRVLATRHAGDRQ